MTISSHINIKDIIEVSIGGDIKYYKLLKFFMTVGALSNKQDIAGKDVLLLVDMSEVTSIERLAKKLITTMFTISIFDKFAFYGANQQIKVDMLDIAKGSNRVKKVIPFETKELAEEWLLS